jgi:transposase
MSSLKRLGIDEIALRKGQGDYIVVLVDLERRVPLEFAPSRKQEDVRKVLEGWGEAVLSQIVEVSIDLSGNYKGLVNQLIPNAAVVADRFHVMKIVNQDLEAARKTLSKANDECLDAVEKERVAAVLKQSKYALLKPEEKLTQKQKAKLEEIRAALPSLAQMHQQKEAFRAIFEQAKDWGDGTFQLLDWLADAPESFKESVGTICRWFGEVTAYFDNRTTSGAVEGINNKLKLIKRSGYGFRNFNNFQLRCLICWHLAVGVA